MKTVIQLLAVSLFFSACSTYQDIAKRTELSEDLIRAKLIPGKKCRIELNSGLELKLKVTRVDSLHVHGTQTSINGKNYSDNSFSESYSNLHHNANSIAVKNL